MAGSVGKSVRAVLLGAALAASASAGAPPPQVMERYQGCLLTGAGGVDVELEHAVTRDQHRLGLMERTRLPDSAGMLFFYRSERAATAGFWMYRTRLPLDIAWLDNNGVILAMDTMEPCQADKATDCPTWAPGVRHYHVLEMNAGFFDEHNVTVGDRLVADLNDNKPCLPAD